MTKPTKRKAFNFLRSYFDVLNELKSDKDKLDFLIAIINKQFLNETPKDLSFVVNLCYESQRHSIESSVKGYEQKTGNSLKIYESEELQGGMQGGMQGGSVQEEDKEKEEEKEEYTKKDIDFIYSLYPTVCKVQNRATGKNSKNKTKIKSILKENSIEELESIIKGYLINSKLSESYIQNFGTFLNNLPDINDLKETYRVLSSNDPNRKETKEEAYQRKLKDSRTNR